MHTIIRNFTLLACALLLTACQNQPQKPGSDPRSSTPATANEAAVVKAPEPVTHIITSIASKGGHVIPSGDTSVNEGEHLIIEIKPDSGYEISNIQVDGNSLGAIERYNTGRVHRSHTVMASFNKIKKVAPVVRKHKPVAAKKPVAAVKPAPQPVIARIEPDPPKQIPKPNKPDTPQHDALWNEFHSQLSKLSNPQRKGWLIALEREHRDDGFHDYSANTIMVLRNKAGDEVTRYIRTRGLEQSDDGDKILTIFHRPADIKGTALLTFSHKQVNDDQWLYLPALKRVKRISSGNKSGAFVGSEFSYEDLSSQEVEKYTYKWLRDETLHGESCFVVEAFPTDKKSGYTRQVQWYDKSQLRIHKIDYYDKKNTLLKTLETTAFTQYLNRYWRADSSNMHNHQTGKSTRVTWSDYKFRTGLTNKDFRKAALKRAR